ncbi:serine hydrolase [Lewinella sp. W8]|uniref:serine hydrolase domain-containing protein n=1 Tax=Lewinella sp. W8 TaxID=2528208 RepID=UPI001067DF25|nr:serine hydrolase domain-containing protein [Lewinella sp. W8]MTB52687.1 serine hydrolase [Lewinella sp. W8]
MAKPITLLVILLVSFIPLFSQSSPETDREAITKILRNYTGEDSPGLAVGVVKDGQIFYEQYLGLANLDHKIRFDASTRSNIASTAKQFTALMVLSLSREGQLSLEDDIRQYLPSLYPAVNEAIKIRHLINHTSGIRDYVFLLEMMNKPFWRQVGMGNNDVIELLEQQQELAHAPGTTYAYSNSGYTVLTKIIEQVSGEKFNDYSKAFFEKLGMHETAFIRRYMGVIPNRADSYSDWGDGNWLSTPAVTKFNGDGFLYTTLKDQLIFELAVQRAYQSNDELLLQAQGPIPNSEITTYGFGLELDGRLGRRAPYHSGSTFGYHSHTTRFPQENLSVFVMSNNGRIWSGEIADEVAAVLLPEMEEEIAYDSRLYEGVNEDAQIDAPGQYLSPTGDLIRVVREEGQLFWRMANYNPYELVREGPQLFSAAYNEKFKIRFFGDELVRFYPSGRTITYRKQAVVPASFTDLEGFVGTYRSSELDMSFELRMTADKELKLLFSNRDDERDVEVLNRNELLASNFRMKVVRDRFDRATDILVTLNDRARNNRFKKKTNLKFQPMIETENGSIQVTTIGGKHGDGSQILLTKNYPNGNEVWFKQFGGNGYDKASSILATEDGYLIIGSTSSYGNGNYDMFVIKTDKEGQQQWQNTYGGFFNEYGYSAEATEGGYLIKGSVQQCTSRDVLTNECTTNVWFVSIDENGQEVGSEVLEEIGGK